MSSAETLRDYLDSVEAMAAVVGEIDDAAWATLAEAPPGHVAMHAVALYVLWDSWIHERDIAIPLGSEPAVDEDEVRGVSAVRDGTWSVVLRVDGLWPGRAISPWWRRILTSRSWFTLVRRW